MTQLETYTILAAIWLTVAWLPYILDRVMVRGLVGAMANYDPAAAPQTPWAQRAMRAHKVAVEAFTAFAPLAVMAMLMAPDDTYPGLLAMVWFYAMLAHYVVYCLGITVLRTLLFVVAVAATLGIALRLLGTI